MNEVQKAEPSIDVFGFFSLYNKRKIKDSLKGILRRGQVGNERFNQT